MNRNNYSNYGNYSNAMYFGVKTALSKQDRAILSKLKKSDLIDEANKLGLMVSDKATKEQLYNLVKNAKQNPYVKKNIDMSDLFEGLPDVERREFMPRQEEPKLLKVPLSYQRTIRKPTYDTHLKEAIKRKSGVIPGSKIVRSEVGLSKQEKTILRKQIRDQMDELAELYARI